MQVPARNTDGADTLYSNNITFRHWSVDNGDDGKLNTDLKSRVNDLIDVEQDCSQG
jgi:hypothetical protein